MPNSIQKSVESALGFFGFFGFLFDSPPSESLSDDDESSELDAFFASQSLILFSAASNAVRIPKFFRIRLSFFHLVLYSFDLVQHLFSESLRSFDCFSDNDSVSLRSCSNSAFIVAISGLAFH